MKIPLASALAFAAVGITHAQVVIDGSLDVGEGYEELAVQTVASNWGANNHLSNIHAVQDGDELAIFIGGRADGNAIILFLDTGGPGGMEFIPNNLITSGGEEGTINNFGSSDTEGMTFEEGFTPNMAFRVFGGGAGAFVNRYNFATGVRTYSGQADSATISDGPLTAARVVWSDLDGDPEEHADGIELRIDLGQVGAAAGTSDIRMMAMLVNDGSTWGSNQILGARTGVTDDMTNTMTGLNWENEPGTQTLAVEVDRDFESWIAGFFPGETDPAIIGPDADPDSDGLTNLEEFNIGTDPSNSDTDGDGVPDGLEVNGYVWSGGAFVADPNGFITDPLNPDTDGDGFLDGNEVRGLGPPLGLGFVSDPTVFNAINMTVAGTFSDPPFDPVGFDSNAEMTRVGTTLETQYQWTYNILFDDAGEVVDYKFTNGRDWDEPGHRNWGQGSGFDGISVGGGDISRTIIASGAHRFNVDIRNNTQSLERRTFDTYLQFRQAYGLSGSDASQTANANPADGWTDYQNFLANTDPLAADTDGDGIIDSLDPAPLFPSRTVTLSVDMSVQVDNGAFNPGAGDTVVVEIFNGPNAGLGRVPLSDPESDDVYSVDIEAQGDDETLFGEYKFVIVFADSSDLYEPPPFVNRNFELGPLNDPMVIPTVWFGDEEPPSGSAFDDWIAGLFPGETDPDIIGPDADPDGDGFSNLAEFLFGSNPTQPTGSLSTLGTNGSGDIVLSWLQRDSGALYALLESTTMEQGSWDFSSLVPTLSSDQTGVPEGYSRHEVEIPVASTRMFFRVEAIDEDMEVPL